MTSSTTKSAKSKVSGSGTKPAASSDEREKLFVITPIGADGTPERRHADWVFHMAIAPLCEEFGYLPLRSDLISTPGMIDEAIFEALIEADLCVADLSFLNPNVLYEMGVRHTLQKPIIHIAAGGTKLPFDTAPYRTIFFDTESYQALIALREGLKAQIEEVRRPGFQVRNPLTAARGFVEISEKGDSAEQLITGLSEQVQRLSAQVRDLRAETARRVATTYTPQNALSPVYPNTMQPGAIGSASVTQAVDSAAAGQIIPSVVTLDAVSSAAHGDWTRRFG